MSGLFGTAASTATANTLGDIKSDVALSNPPSDSISSIAFSPAQDKPDFLAVASWDNKIRVYEIAQNGQSEGRHAYEHQQPVLNVDFSKVFRRPSPPPRCESSAVLAGSWSSADNQFHRTAPRSLRPAPIKMSACVIWRRNKTL